MNNDGILGGALNQLGQTAKQAAKQVVKMPEEMGKDVGEQVAGTESAAFAKGSGEPKQWQSDEERIKFLKDLYGSTEQTSSAGQASSLKQNLLKEPAPSADAKAMADKEEQKKLMELRNQLHKDFYYDPTFNPVKKQEERPAEKVEKEKKQEMQDLQQKEAKKPPPIAVQRERNKAEMFRGAAG